MGRDYVKIVALILVVVLGFLFVWHLFLDYYKVSVYECNTQIDHVHNDWVKLYNHLKYCYSESLPSCDMVVDVGNFSQYKLPE